MKSKMFIYVLAVLAAFVIVLCCGCRRELAPGESSANEISLAESSAVESPASESSAVESPASESSAAESSSAENSATENSFFESSATESAAVDNSKTESSEAESLPTESSASESSAAESAAPENCDAGHDYSQTATDATCTVGGEIVYTCKRCGDTKTEATPPAGHIRGNSTQSLDMRGNGYALVTRYGCSVCGLSNAFLTEKVFSCAFSENGNIAAIPAGTTGVKLEATMLQNGKIRLDAKSESIYKFIGWSDGFEYSQRTVDGSTGLKALFGFESYSMPVLSICTEKGAEVVRRDSYVKCGVSVSNCDKAFALSDVNAEIRVRGNASSMYGDVNWIRENKVHYRLKFTKKTNVLGVNSGAERKSWVLLRGDNNFVKDPFAFKLFNRLSEGKYFSPDFTYVSVYLNYEYIGVYIICDQIQTGNSRVDITENEDGDTTVKTGYLLEIDNYFTAEPYYFYMNYGGVQLTDMYGITHNAAQVGYSFKYDTVSNEQIAYVRKFADNAYRVVYEAIINGRYFKLDENNNMVNAPEITSAKEAVSNVIDLDAAVAMYITEEVCAERDVGIGSFFMYVDFTDETPRLTFCAPWDFSWAYGNSNGFTTDKFCVSAWQPQEFIDHAGNRSSTWFITLYQGDFFVNMVKERWDYASRTGLFEELFGMIRDISDNYETEFRMNDERWNSGSQSYGANAMIDWLTERIKWLTTQWG